MKQKFLTASALFLALGNGAQAASVEAATMAPAAAAYELAGLMVETDGSILAYTASATADVNSIFSGADFEEARGREGHSDAQEDGDSYGGDESNDSDDGGRDDDGHSEGHDSDEGGSGEDGDSDSGHGGDEGDSDGGHGGDEGDD